VTQTAFHWTSRSDTDPLNKLLAEGWAVQQGFVLPYSVLLILGRTTAAVTSPPPAFPGINLPPTPATPTIWRMVASPVERYESRLVDQRYEAHLADQAGVTLTNGGADGITFTPGPAVTSPFAPTPCECCS
jgi:hypothetical protein